MHARPVGGRGVCLLVAALVGVACGPPMAGDAAAARGLPAEISVNSSNEGVAYVQAAAVAAIVERHTPMRGFAVPTRSHVAAMPRFQQGRLDFIFVSESEMHLANRGGEYYAEVGPTPMRIVAAGPEIMFSVFTSPRSGIRRFEDLAGRRVMWDTRTGGVFYWAGKHVLDCFDLADRIVSIPSPIPTERAEALKAGRIDAYTCSTQFQAMEILHSSVGVEMLDIPDACAAYVQERYPALYPAILPRGANGGMVPRDIKVLAASTALHAHADLDDGVVYAVLEAIYDHFDTFVAAHPSLEDMRLDRAVSLNAINPYHAGAIRFFQDRGVWSDRAGERQRRLLDELGAAR